MAQSSTTGTDTTLDLLADGSELRERWRSLLDGWRLTEIAAVHDAGPGYEAARWTTLLRDWPQPATPQDIRVVLEEIGRARCPLPVHAGLVQPDAALTVLADHGVRSAAQHRALLRTGSRYAIGMHDAAGRPAPQHVSVLARPAAGGGWILSGRTRHTTYGDSARQLLVPAVVDGAGRLLLVVVPAAAAGAQTVTRATAGADRLTDIELAGVQVPAEAVLAGATDGDDRATLAVTAAGAAGLAALCAELTGMAAGLLEATVTRVRSRQAYGQPLAALPTVQQRAADMYLDLIAARDAGLEAAGALDPVPSGDVGSSRHAVLAAAKLTATAAALRVAAGAHQLCGGWGQLDEAGLHHYTRAIKAAECQLGTPSHHREVIGRLLRG